MCHPRSAYTTIFTSHLWAYQLLRFPTKLQPFASGSPPECKALEAPHTAARQSLLPSSRWNTGSIRPSGCLRRSYLWAAVNHPAVDLRLQLHCGHILISFHYSRVGLCSFLGHVWGPSIPTPPHVSAKLPLHSHLDGHNVTDTDSDVQTVRALMYFELVFITGEIQALFYSSASSHSIFLSTIY